MLRVPRLLLRRSTTVVVVVPKEADGQPIGTAPKLPSHHAQTPLHRAFSCFVFNVRGEFLLSQRALGKKVFPGIWTNSCCGHPAPGEETAEAVTRRLHDELGMTPAQLDCLLPDFRYRAEMDGIVENEFCPVFVALCEDAPHPNPAEVETCRWIPWQEFVDRVEHEPASLSPWSVLETRELLTSRDFAKWREHHCAG